MMVGLEQTEDQSVAPQPIGDLGQKQMLAAENFKRVGEILDKMAGEAKARGYLCRVVLAWSHGWPTGRLDIGAAPNQDHGVEAEIHVTGSDKDIVVTAVKSNPAATSYFTKPYALAGQALLPALAFVFS
jgi:hypothetical protein